MAVFKISSWAYIKRFPVPQWWARSAFISLCVCVCVCVCVCALLRKSPVATAGHEDRGDKWIPCLQENTLEAQENFVVYEEHVKPIKSELSSCCCSFCRLQFFSSLASSVTTQRAGLVSEGGGTHTHYTHTTHTHTQHTHTIHTQHTDTHTHNTHMFFFSLFCLLSVWKLIRLVCHFQMKSPRTFLLSFLWWRWWKMQIISSFYT